MKLYKINNYLENTKLNIYWVIIIAFAVVSETMLLNYFFPNKNEFLTGICFGVWALNIYIWRKLLLKEVDK